MSERWRDKQTVLKKKKREIQNAGELKRERTDNQTSFEKRVKRRVN